MASRKVEVTARPDCPLSDKKAKILCHEVEGLYAAGVAVTSKRLFEHAKPKSSPIHDLFEWDGKSAVEQLGIDQACKLLGFLQVFEIRTKRMARAYYSIDMETVDEGAVRSYHPRRVVMDNDSAMQQLSVRWYKALCSTVREVESSGLVQSDAAWKIIVRAVNQNPPSAAALKAASK
jgi:hypothetical protein